MSTSVMASVWPLQMPPVAKSVLVSLADNSNDSGYCWPSIETITARTCYGRTSVIEAIKWLEQAGYLSPDRSNGRKTTYQLTVSAATSSNRKPVRHADRCATQTGPADGLNQSATRTKPVRQPDTNRKEPSRTVIKSYTQELPVCIAPDVWAMWHEYRVKKSGKAWTEHAQQLAVKSLVKISEAGHDIRAVVETSIERGYAGLFAPKTQGGNHDHPRESIADRSARRAAAIFERLDAQSGQGPDENMAHGDRRLGKPLVVVAG